MRLGASLLACLAIAGCTRTLDVSVTVVTACDQPDALDDIHFITIRTEGASIDTPREVTYSADSGSGKLQSVPTTSDGRITILGHKSDVGEPADVAGGVGALDLTGQLGAISARVVVGAVDTFVGTSEGARPTSCTQMSKGRQGHTVTLLDDGKVFIAGGEQVVDNERLLLRSTEIYDPADGSFREGPELPEGRAYHSATKLRSGRVLVCGGEGVVGNRPTALATCVIYEAKEKRFSDGPLMTLGRFAHSATLLADGRVAVAGGRGIPAEYYLATELYDDGESTGTGGAFSPAPNLSVPRAQHTATLLGDGQHILFAGGRDKTTVRDELEVWDITQTRALGTLTKGRYAHAAASLADGRVVLGGGFTTLSDSGNPDATASVEIFDPSAAGGGAISCGTGLNLTEQRGELFAAPLPTPPGGRSSVVFGGGTRVDGSVAAGAEVVSAGLARSCQEVTVRATTGRLKQARTRAEAVALSGGDVLVVGGSQSIGVATVPATAGELFIAPR